MIESKKVRKENEKEIGKEKKEITPSRDGVVTDYNRDDNHLRKVKLMASKFPKKEIFDGLHKRFLEAKFTNFPFLEN